MPEFNDMLSKNIEKQDKIWEEIKGIEKKIETGNLSQKKEGILKERKDLLEEKLKKMENGLYV